MATRLEVLSEQWALHREMSADLYNYLVEKAELERAEILILKHLIQSELDEAKIVRQLQEAGYTVNDLLAACEGGAFDE